MAAIILNITLPIISVRGLYSKFDGLIFESFSQHGWVTVVERTSDQQDDVRHCLKTEEMHKIQFNSN